jgi:hypothetical protein
MGKKKASKKKGTKYGAHEMTTGQMVKGLVIPLALTGAILYYGGRAVYRQFK